MGSVYVESFRMNVLATHCDKCISELSAPGKDCQMCKKAYNQRYFQKNKQQISERSSAYKKEWVKNNPDKRRLYETKWREQNYEKVQQQWKRTYLKRREKILAYTKEWRKANPDHGRMYRDRRRGLERDAFGSYTPSEVRAVFKRYKDRCAECGLTERLELDHIVPISKGGCNFSYNLRPLCFSCNRSKNASLSSVSEVSLFDKVKWDAR